MTYELNEDTKRKIERNIETINDASGFGEINLLVKNKQVMIIKTTFTEETKKQKAEI